MAKSHPGLKICLIGSWAVVFVVLASLSTPTTANLIDGVWHDTRFSGLTIKRNRTEWDKTVESFEKRFAAEQAAKKGRSIVLIPLSSSSFLSPRARMTTNSETSETIANDSWDTSETSSIVFPPSTKIGAAGIEVMKPMTPMKGMKPMTPIKMMTPISFDLGSMGSMTSSVTKNRSKPSKRPRLIALFSNKEVIANDSWDEAESSVMVFPQQQARSLVMRLLNPRNLKFEPMDFNFDPISQGPDINIDKSWDESESSVTVFPKKTKAKKSPRTLLLPLLSSR